MLVVLEKGSVWAWGHCIWGQLGLGGDEMQIAGGTTTTPVCVGGLDVFGGPIVSTACGSSHSAAVSGSGSVFTWGYNRDAMLGHGDEELKLVPTLIGKHILAGLSALQVACGGNCTVVLTEDGSVWSVGNGSMGQLGHGNRDNTSQLTRVSPAVFSGAIIVMIASGFSHTVASDKEGSIWSWGAGYAGRLGHGDQNDRLIPTRIQNYHHPYSTMFGKCVVVSAGCFHTVAVMDTGALFGWGSNKDGQIGLRDILLTMSPTQIGCKTPHGSCIQPVISAAAGGHHTVAVNDKGFVWSFGFGYEGQLGVNSTQSWHTPMRIPRLYFEGHHIVSVSAGLQHSSAVTFDGTIFTWGKGQGLGHGNGWRRVTRPTRVALPSHERVGRCHLQELSKLHTLAFAMGTHNRLSSDVDKDSKCVYFELPSDLVQRIVHACVCWPEGQVGEMRGMVQMLGGYAKTTKF